MKVAKILLALALPSLIAVGCNSGDDPSLDPEQPPGEVSQAIGEASCGTLTNPQEWFNGSIPDPGVVTPASYSHSKCYKSFVTRIYGLTDFRSDIVVADARVDRKSWHTASVPPRNLNINPRDDFRLMTPLPYGKADCEALFMRASLYENGVHKRTVDAHGVWTQNVFLGSCTPPQVTFGGINARNTNVDFLYPGRNYTVAATYRVRDASAAATLAMRFVTPPAPCGHYGQFCCPSDWYCDGAANCTSDNVCVACGHEGQPVCLNPASNEKYCIGGESLVNDGGICRHCGDEGEACCDWLSPPYNCSWTNLSCQSGRCKSSTPRPKPAVDCNNCGQGENSTCCDASCPLLCKKSWHACMPGNYCFSPGLPPANSVCTTAVAGECYDVFSGEPQPTSLTGTTAQGCGENIDVARLRAGASLALAVPLTDQDEEEKGSCLYYFTN